MQVVVTTTRRPTEVDIHRARHYARALHTPFVERGGLSFPAVLNTAAQTAGQEFGGALVVHWPTLSIWTPTGILQYHPGMALHRVASLRRGAPDTMVDAMQLHRGDRVLDCTAGLASDAVVAAYAVGAEGKVIGLESVAAVALLLKVGLARYPGQGPELTAAMRRVHVRHADYHQALAQYPAASFDVVYFDPMFTAPVQESSGIAPLRPLADHAPLSASALQEACRVARRCVVVKERRDGPLATVLPWDRIHGGRKSRIAYLIRNAAGC